jgi:hypothetical protein
MMETHSINLDGSILASADEWSLRAERLLGVAGHEAAHLCWSPRERIPSDPLFRYLNGVLEDERIEALLARRIPVLAHPLHVARRDLLRGANAGEAFLPTLFTLVRCEQEVESSQWERHDELLQRAIVLLTPFPMTPENLRKAVLRLALLIPPEEHKKIPPPPELTAAAMPGDDQPEAGNLKALVRSRLARKLRLKEEARQCGDWPEVHFRTASAEPEAYHTARSELGAMPAALADRLRAILPRTPQAQQSQGKLDRRRLHAFQYDRRLFRSKPVAPLSLSIALILDLSSSMTGNSERIAQRVAVMLSEAIARLPDVDLQIYGHSADRDDTGSVTMCTVITRFPTTDAGRSIALGKLGVNGCNRDAHALRVIGEQLLASSGRASRQRIAIIVADGAPHARNFSGDFAIEKTREALLWLESAWGPVLFVATDAVPELRRMVPGPSFRFCIERPVEDLARHLTSTIRRQSGRGIA